MIRILASGLQTTIQDLGRPGYCHIGVSAAGAADPLALRVANRLVGNADSAGAFEMTLRGGRFEFAEAAVVSVCGGDFEASVPMWEAVAVAAGGTVEVGGCRAGARCYLAVRGGVEAESYLGSVSTHLLSGFGRVVQKGDTYLIRDGELGPVRSGRVDVSWRRLDQVRVTAGAHTDHFAADAVFSFLGQKWRVSDQSNRQGIRLDGEPISALGALGAMLSEGAALGAVQVSPNGQPLILFVDSQTTGGYPVICNSASIDTGVIGQLRPGSSVGFVPVGLSEALRLLRKQEEWIRAI